MKTFWGDLHAHCGVSYGRGTPRAALAHAREHLDFCSLTGHAFWPDIPMDNMAMGESVGKHLGAFERLRHFWRSFMDEVDAANCDGRFVTLPSYEWHSGRYGDWNCYFNTCDIDLVGGDSVEELAASLARQAPAHFLVPHHCSYASGNRGTDWTCFDDARSPLAEIVSNHGCCESDDASFDYHHAMGPRTGENTIREGLRLGHRFGFIGGTDTHDGYPGHYGHGITGIVSGSLDRKSLWEALRQRRTVASTGARIEADMRLGEAGIGESATNAGGRDLRLSIRAAGAIDKVEVVELVQSTWRVRSLPLQPRTIAFHPDVYKLKIETGWGCEPVPTRWNVRARVNGGAILSASPCFRYCPETGEEDAPLNRILEINERESAWQCLSMPNPCGQFGGTHFNAGGPQAVILDIEASVRTRLHIETDDLSFNVSLPLLALHSTARHIGTICSPAIKLDRAVPSSEYVFNYREEHAPLSKDPGCMYVRLSQSDGQAAWMSPIWYE